MEFTRTFTLDDVEGRHAVRAVIAYNAQITTSCPAEADRDVDDVAFLVGNQAPTHTTPLLESTDGSDDFNQNLTCYNQSTSDIEGDNVTNIFTFYKDEVTNKLFHLPFDSDTNDIFGDAPSSESGTSYLSGKVGKGIYVSDGDDLRYSPTGNINTTTGTVSFWVNAQNDIWENSASNYFFYYRISGDNHIYIQAHSNNYTRFRYEGTSDAQNYNWDGSDSWGADEWHHIAMTWNSSAPYFKAYADGQLLSTRTSIKPFNDTGGTLWVGDYNTNEADAIIDELIIYDRVLSDTEINLHYNEVYNKILSDDTSVGEVYRCDVTSSDGSKLGITRSSNNLTILETYGDLNVSLDNPSPDQTTWVNQNTTFWVNATVNCTGDVNESCGDVSANVVYNGIVEQDLYNCSSPTARTSGGTVTSAGDNGPGEPDDSAFDDSSATKWLDFGGADGTSWIAYQYGGSAQYKIAQYSMISANDAQHRDPKDWNIEGSNDGSTWTIVDTQSGIEFTSRGQTQTFSVANASVGLYEYYRLNITDLWDSGTANSVQLEEIKEY